MQAIAYEIKESYSDRIFSVTEVSVAPDLATAKVFISLLDDSSGFIERLNTDSKKIRYAVTQKINLRRSPELKFFLDTTDSEYEKIDRLLKS
ncbi:MAG: Ribosome-binding factor A [bacterium ADurb.Bin212]|nr:MAG: Ribosome-binding factor A [bacterium ADurb.Bin212]